MLVAAAVLIGGCGEVEVQHVGAPQAPVPASLDAGNAPITPFPSFGSPPPAAEVARLRVDALPAGHSQPLSDLLGRGATVVAFWQTSCRPCIDELPSLQELARRTASQGVRVILVDLGEDAAAISSWLRDHRIDLPSWRDGDPSAHDGLHLLGVPTTAVLGPGGTVVARLEGAADVAGVGSVLRRMGISTQ